jgi:predicted NBD/HSP70 family sugar kinase
VHQAALQGEAAAREVIERAGYHLGLGLVGVLHCFNPQALILGGGLIALGDLYVGPALATVRERAFAQILSDVRMTTAALGERAGALGAAALVMEGRNR